MALQLAPALLKCKSEQQLAMRPEHESERGDELSDVCSGEEAFGAELVPLVPKPMPTASSTPSPASSKGSGGSASSPPTAQPAQARDAAEGQAQGKTKQQTKKENLKSAAAKKALPHLAEEERAFYSQCNICDEWLPLTEFPPGGGCVCARDDLARESLQRMLRNRWKKSTRRSSRT